MIVSLVRLLGVAESIPGSPAESLITACHDGPAVSCSAPLKSSHLGCLLRPVLDGASVSARLMRRSWVYHCTQSRITQSRALQIACVRPRVRGPAVHVASRHGGECVRLKMANSSLLNHLSGECDVRTAAPCIRAINSAGSIQIRHLSSSWRIQQKEYSGISREYRLGNVV
jgi:hypothetical protein